MKEIMAGFDFSYLLGILLGVIPSLVCITLHELAHGLTAWRLGDDTAKNAGRLTLNPLKHLDPIGLLMMLTVRFGWAKPVPVNMFRFRNPKRGMALTALAGPMCNFLITIFFLFLYGLLYRPLSADRSGQAGEIALDGSKILFSLLPDQSYWRLMKYERYGSVIMLALVWSGVLGKPLSRVIQEVYSFLFPIARTAFRLVNG